MRATYLALLVTLSVSLAMPLAASAAQPVPSNQTMEACLQPLFDRMADIRNEQRSLNKRLDDASLSPESKARVQADYQALEGERKRIEKAIMRAA